jgi:hypothetical protein
MADEKLSEEDLKRYEQWVSLRKSEKELAADIAKRVGFLNEEKAALSSIIDQVRINIELKEEETKLEEIKYKRAVKLVQQLRAREAEGKAIDEARLARLQKIIEASGKEIKLQKEHIESVNNLENAADNLFGLLGVSEKWKKTFIGSLADGTKSADQLSMKMSLLAGKIKQTFTVANLLGSTLMKMQEASLALAITQDTAIADFNKMTGAAGKLNNAIVTLQRTNHQFALSNQDVASAQTALFVSMSNFTGLNEKTQHRLTETTAKLELIGISAQTTAQNMDFLTKALGMSTQGSERLQQELLATAAQLKLPPAAIMEGFAQAAPSLAKHGKQMSTVFKNLAAQSKATGIAIQTLIGITEKFDTFEGAADAAGRLNAVLGGDLLNSVELLMANEDERIEMLNDTIKLSGKSWATLNKFERQAIATAAGISDMDVAARLFNPNLEGMTKAQKDAILSEEEYNKMLKEAIPLAKKFAAAAMSLALTFRPIVDLLHKTVDGFNQLNDWTAKATNGVFTFGNALAGLLLLLTALKTKKLLSTAITGIKGMGSAAVATQQSLSSAAPSITKWTTDAKNMGESSAGAAKGISQQVKAQDVAGKSAKSSAGSMLAFGFAILMIGAGIAVAAYGMSLLVGAFAGLNPEQINGAVLAITRLGATIIALALIMAFAGLPAVTGMLAFGAALLMVGAGIGLAAAGMSLLVGAFAGLNLEQINGAVLAITRLGATIIALALIMAFAGLPAVTGMLAFGAALLMVGAGIGLAAAGMSLLAQAFSLLQPAYVFSLAAGLLALTLAALPLPLAALSITAATMALIGLSVISLLILPGLMALGLAVNFLGIGFAKIATAAANFNESLSLITDSVVARYSMIRQEIEKIAKIVADMPLTKLAPFSFMAAAAMVNPLVGPALAAATAIAVDNPAITKIQKTSENITELKSTTENNVTNTTKQKVAGGQTAADKNQLVPVQIILDGKIIGKIIDDRSAKTFNKNFNEIVSPGKSTPLHTKS